MADEIAATDSAAADGAATAEGGLAETTAEATHGGEASEQQSETTDEQQQQQDTPQGEQDGESAPAQDDDEDDESSEGQTEEEKSRSQQRRERRRAREAERIQQAVNEALAAAETRRQADETRRQQEAQSQEAVKQRVERFQERLGVPDAEGKPGTLALLQAEIDEANRQIRAELTSPTGADLDALTTQAAAAEGKRARLLENNELASDIQDFIWGQINEGGFGRAGEIPEMAADANVLKRYFGAKDIHQANLLLAQTVREATARAKDAEIAKLKADHAAQVKAVTDERNTWRARAGGAASDTVTGGQAAAAPGALTPQAYAEMSYEERIKLRSSPEGRARIDAMTGRR